jgi:hypothetical protein
MNYKSSVTLLGLPLVHVAIGSPEGSPGVRGIAKGWIAVGDIAFGVAFALGGLASGVSGSDQRNSLSAGNKRSKYWPKKALKATFRGENRRSKRGRVRSS